MSGASRREVGRPAREAELDSDAANLLEDRGSKVLMVGTTDLTQERPRTESPRSSLTLQWFADHDLPEDIIEYPGAGLHGCFSRPSALTLHGW